MDSDFDAVEKPLPSGGAQEEENLTGQRGTARDFPAARGARTGRSVPGGPEFTDNPRLDIPSTVIATGYTSEEYKDAGRRATGSWRVSTSPQCHWVDLPTSHWPMWSRPKELAAVIGDVARAASAA